MKLISLLLLLFNLYGQEDEDIRKSSAGLGVAISFEFREGHYLLYDCKRSYFACVDEYSFDLCKEKREKAIKDGKMELICVPIKEMKNFASCKKEHYKRMSTVVNKGFCIRRKEDLLKY